MATRRKKKGTTSAVVPAKSAVPALPQQWQDEFAQYMDESAAVAEGGVAWPFISLRGGSFRHEGEAMDGPLPVIILGEVHENGYYKGKFDPNNPVPPNCYALGAKETELAPPADLKTKESDTCATCWANVFGTDPDGRKGKACKNMVRLVMISADDLAPEALAETPGVRMRVPVTSVRKQFAPYSNKVTKGLKRPLLTVVTTLDLIDDDVSQFKLTFDLADLVPVECFEALKVRVQEAREPLYQKPQAVVEAATVAKKGAKRRKVQRKKVVRKKVASKAVKKTGGRKKVRRSF